MRATYAIRLLVLGAVIAILVFQTMQKPALLQHPALPSEHTGIATGSAVLGVVTKSADCVTDGTLPDSSCTPGAIDPNVTQDNIGSTICVSGYTKSVRPDVSVTNTIKTNVMIAYRDTGTKADYELDHLISLELGGCPDCVANLWPEPYGIALGAREKDKVENYLRKQVCSGAISLSQAQSQIARDWVSVYRQLPQ